MSKKFTFGIVVAVIVCVLLGGAWRVSSLFKSVMTPPKTFIVGEAFIEHLAAGEIDQATELVSSDLRSGDFGSTLRGFVEENALLFTSSTRVEFTGRGFYDRFRYAYGTISSNDASSFIYLEFVDEDGETRVSYMSFNEGDIPKIGSEDESGN